MDTFLTILGIVVFVGVFLLAGRLLAKRQDSPNRRYGGNASQGLGVGETGPVD